MPSPSMNQTPPSRTLWCVGRTALGLGQARPRVGAAYVSSSEDRASPKVKTMKHNDDWTWLYDMRRMNPTASPFPVKILLRLNSRSTCRPKYSGNLQIDPCTYIAFRGDFNPRTPSSYRGIESFLPPILCFLSSILSSSRGFVHCSERERVRAKLDLEIWWRPQ